MQTYLSSYYLYLGTIAISVFFAWMATAFPLKTLVARNLNPVFWILSFLTLWFIMGFRLEIGVDYFSYQGIYWEGEEHGFLGYYKTGNWTEPGYVLLLYIVNLFYGDFTGVFVCTSFIGLFLFYLSFTFVRRWAHPAWCVFVFSTTQYFYYFGVDRLFLAVSIVTFGLKFIVLGKRNKYFLTIFVAALFHISALCMLLFPIIFGYVRTKTDVHGQQSVGVLPQIKIYNYIAFLILTPLLLYCLLLIIPYLPEKYHSYSMNMETNFISIILKVPVAIFMLTTMRHAQAYYPPLSIYVNMYIFSIFIQVFSSIVNIGRIGWYFWISLCFVFPIIVRSFSRNLPIKIGVMICVILYCIGYMFNAYLTIDSIRAQNMFPYRNLFFEL